MMIEGWSSTYYKTRFETGLLARLAPWVAGILTVVLVWRVGSLVAEGQIGQVFVPRLATVLWWGEILVGYVAPILLFASKARFSKKGLVTAGILTVGGMISLRLNVGFTALMGSLGAQYTPTLMEILFTVGATAGTMVIYTWFVETLPSILGPREDQVPQPMEAAGD
jgi:Ni/Fe-hydrogenase subunit HybB-like protein